MLNHQSVANMEPSSSVLLGNMHVSKLRDGVYKNCRLFEIDNVSDMIINKIFY